MFKNLFIQNQESIGSEIVMDGEYAIVPFRMLSATLIEGHWIEFSEEVLKSALEKFNNVTIFPDHKPSIRDWLGVATNARISMSKGNLGIDADFKIDTIQNPEILRGLQMNPPAIKHCSVGIRIDGKPSHEFKTEWEFERNLGKEKDGSIVRLIVTEILDVSEISLVYKGADPNAMKLERFKLIENNNVGVEYIQPNSQPNLKENDLKVKTVTLKLLGQETKTTDNDLEMTPEELHAIVSKFIDKQSDIEIELMELKKVLGLEDTLATTEVSLKAKDLKKSLAEKEQVAMQLVLDARANALKFYKQYAGENSNPGIETVIENATLTQANALADEYKSLLDKKFPVNPETGTRASFTPNEENKTKKINTKEYEV